MQNFTQELGCFVYEIIPDYDGNGVAVGVRSFDNVGDAYKTGMKFKKNDLVSVDLIRPSRHPDSTNGPFLRLSDNSGWLFEKKNGEVMARRLPVQKGLWAFYVDNVPDGTVLRSHPHPSLPRFSHSPVVKYRPMQLIYCDRRVVSPTTKIASYRVQGTDGWVVEKNEDGTVILIPEHKIKVGMFAFEVAEGSSPISLYKEPSVCKDTRLPVSFEAGEIVVCDVIRPCPYNPQNGPFLRLDDGWGWLYEKISTVPNTQMHQIPVEKGLWEFEVMNSVGIAMRRHPIDDGRDDAKDVKTSTLFKPGDIVKCDRKIKSSGPTSFYRVAGKDGWVFDFRGTHVMMEPREQQMATGQESQPIGGGWSIDFIRGLALAFDLEEIMFNETSRVVSFKTDANERINVYYTTRTVGTALNHPSQGTTQLFRRKCTDEELREIMQHPRIHTGKGYKKRARVNNEGGLNGRYSYEIEGDECIDEEEDYRNKLLEYEKEEEKITSKKMRALKVLKSIDDRRANDAVKMEAKIEERAEEFKQRQREREEAERQRQQEIQAAEHRQRCTCSVCHQVFVNVHAKNQHYEAVHCFRCAICYKDFISGHALSQHKDARGHW